MENYHPQYFSKMRKFWLGFIVATIIGLVFFLYLFYSEKGRLPDFWQHGQYLAISLISAYIVSFTLFHSDRLLNKWISWSNYLAMRLLTGLLVNILLVFAIIGGVLLAMISLQYGLDSLSTQLVLHQDLITKISIIALLSVVIYTIIYFAIYSYNQYTVVHVEHARAQRNQLALQFETLRSQLSPHYLFNCLNTISSLVYKDAALAEDFIRRLAATYQYIMRNNEKRFVLLEDEVEFVKSYNYLLQVRFENNLKLDINLPSNIMKTKIPPLTLQMLVENAVKHNVISKENPLNIYISAVDNTDIKISNTKTQKPAHVSSFHVGINNIQQRYQYFTSRKIRIDDAHSYTVTLPVIHSKTLQTAS